MTVGVRPWTRGVAPMRNPVLRSCEVSPAFAAAMHTTPPMVMASAPNAGAVQPLTKKIADVAIRVAMVIPETGFEELPINPTIREETGPVIEPWRVLDVRGQARRRMSENLALGLLQRGTRCG